MSYDIVIKNGLIVDGTGLPPFKGDVAIKDGTIVARGKISGGDRIIDAEGMIVAPGFVDIHTHYDAQVLWDPLLVSSPWHGTTTVVMGNCGYTLAPCRAEDHDFYTAMFARVEGVNKIALEKGVDWRWRSFPDYLKRLGENRLGINVATLIGHSAVRRSVMGAAASSRAATETEISQMKNVVAEALAAGAFGFSTSRFPNHLDGDGAPVPSRQASQREILELAAAVGEYHFGGIGIVPGSQLSTPDGSFDEAESRLMVELSTSTGRPVNWNSLSHRWEQPEGWKRQIEFMMKASMQGAQVYAVARSPRLDMRFSFNHPASVAALGSWPTWDRVLGLPFKQRIEQLRQKEVRDAMRADIETADSRKLPYRRLENVVFLGGKSAKFSGFVGQTLGVIHKQVGKSPAEIAIDWSLEENLEAEFAFVGRTNGDLEAVSQILKCPLAIPGISDGGAHTDRLSECYYSTYVLAHWVRDTGVLSLEEAIRGLTFLPAAFYGLRDRGLLREGSRADVVVFDLERLNWQSSHRVNDFPGGQSRMVTPGEGYKHVIVNGEVFYENGLHAGTYPGKLLKSLSYRSN